MQDLMAGPLTEKERRIRRIKNSPPIFIIGSQRSGTTFLYRLIQKYLKIGFGRDNGNFVRLMKLLPYYGDLSHAENLEKLLKGILAVPEFKKRFRGLEININEFMENLEARTYAEVLRRFYAEWADLKDASRWGGKTPDYSMHAPEVHQLFPDAKFLHIIRDGRDVALSLANLDWGAKNPVLAAKHWKERVQSAIAFGRNLKMNSYMEMRYENLVQNPEIEFERLIHFIEHEGDRGQIVERFKREIGDKVKRNNFDKWKTGMPRPQIRAFERMAGDLLKELEYEIIFPEVVGKRIQVWYYAWHQVENLILKLLRGEGFKGLYQRIYRFSHDCRLKIGSYRRNEQYQVEKYADTKD